LRCCSVLLHQSVLLESIFKGCLVNQNFTILCVVYEVLAGQGIATVHNFVTVCS
jgi:hypothetical protein